MKAILLGSGLMLAAMYPAQAQQAYLNCHHLVTTSEERMVDAMNVSTKTGKEHPDFCKTQRAANKAMMDWLKAAVACRSRMADYDNRVAQVRGAVRTSFYVLGENCNSN